MRPFSSTNGYRRSQRTPQVERQIAAGPPLILNEESKIASRQRCLTGPIGNGCLLRHPEEEISEVESGHPAQSAVGRIDPGEDELAVGVVLVVRPALVPVVRAAGLDLMSAERAPPGDVRGDAIANGARRPASAFSISSARLKPPMFVPVVANGGCCASRLAIPE